LFFYQPVNWYAKTYKIVILHNKNSERYWNDEVYHQRSAKKSRIMEEMKNVAET
jgi:hypothetical protein